MKNKSANVDPLKKCLNCGLILADDMPRGLVIDSGEIQGVICVSCAEADDEIVKIGTPKNPFQE